jgi:hypothetical protein
MENITLRSTSIAQSLGLRERKQQDNEVWKTNIQYDYFFNIPTHAPIIYTLKALNSH